MKWFNKIKTGLAKSSTKLNTGITDIFTKRKLDAETLAELEELLISSDIGVETSKKIIASLSKDKFGSEISSEEIKEHLADKIEMILAKNAYVAKYEETAPHVIIICGVNGNGKTTSIGKLTNYFKNNGKQVILAACDTFRAGAVEQLKIWAQRNEVEIIIGEENADPASVAYKAFEAAKSKKVDIVLIDTAGRLQNKLNLMEELAKISRVLKKVDEKAPHETILVLDATTGQNAHSQIEKFMEVSNLTSIIITKLDGTAKAGVVVALADKYQLPIYAIGVGEQIGDLQPFSPRDFAKSLVGL